MNKQAVRVLTALGHTATTRVTSTLGPEQEYSPDRPFIRRKTYGPDADWPYTFWCYHHHAVRKWMTITSVLCMNVLHLSLAELNEELWKLGVTATTQHNEVAPCHSMK